MTDHDVPIGYWCCALDWSLGLFRASDCIQRTMLPDPQWERIVPAADVERMARAFVAVGLELDGITPREGREAVKRLTAEYNRLTGVEPLVPNVEAMARSLKRRYPQLRVSIPELMMGLDIAIDEARR